MTVKPRRVAVMSPQTRLARVRGGSPATQDARVALSAEQVRLATTMRARQLRLALTGLAVTVALLVLGPLVLWLVGGSSARVAGIPLTWLAVAVAPYPVLAVLARWQLRRAERAEASPQFASELHAIGADTVQFGCELPRGGPRVR